MATTPPLPAGYSLAGDTPPLPKGYSIASAPVPAGTPGGVLPGVPATRIPQGLTGAPASGPNATQAEPNGTLTQRIFGRNPVTNPIATAGTHVWNDLTGIPKAATTPVTTQEQAQDPGGWLQNPISRAAYRSLIEPTVNSASLAATNFRNNNFDTGMQDSMDAVPIFGPVARQFSNDTANSGLTSALAGAGADLVTAKVAGKALDAATNPTGMGEGMQDAAASRVNRYMGTTAKDMRNGANPGRGVIRDTSIPGSRNALVRNIQEAQGRVGQQLGDTITAADTNPNAPVITSQQLRPAIENPIYDRTGQLIGPGGTGNVAPLSNLLDSFNETAPEASAPIYGPNAPATVAPTDLWKSIRNIDSNTRFSTDPQVEGVNEVGRDIRGGLRAQLETADPNIKPLSQRYADLRTGGNVLARKLAPHTGLPKSVVDIAGRTLDSAPLQVGLAKLQNAVGSGVAGAGRALGLPNTGIQPGFPAGAAAVYAAPNKAWNQDEGDVENPVEDGETGVPEQGNNGDGNGNQQNSRGDLQNQHGANNTTTPDSHDFSISAWLAQNPGGDADAASDHATGLGYTVVK